MPAQTSISAIPAILKALRSRSRRRLRVLGADGGFLGLLLARATSDFEASGPLVYVASDEASARTVAADVGFFLGLSPRESAAPDARILVIPENETSPYGDAATDPRVLAERMGALYRLQAKSEGWGAAPPELVIVSLRSLLRQVVPPTAYASLCRRWQKDGCIELDEAARDLERAGYQRVDIVEDAGTYAIRGGVIDVYPALGRFPVRIELFGDEIERLRLFDPDSQRSLREVQEVLVHPVRETVSTLEGPLRPAILGLADELCVPSSKTRQILDNLGAGLDFFGKEALTPLFHGGLAPLWDYFPDDTRWYVDNPELLISQARELASEEHDRYSRAIADRSLVVPPADFFVDAERLEERLLALPVVGHGLDVYDPNAADTRQILRVGLDPQTELRAQIEAARAKPGAELLRPVVDVIRELIADGIEHGAWSIAIVAANASHADRLGCLLRGYGLDVDTSPDDITPIDLADSDAATRRPTTVRIFAGALGSGFTSKKDRVFVLSEAEIYGAAVRRETRSRKNVGIQSLTQLSIGDYIVHISHGVGRYLGLKELAHGGVSGDYVQIEYSGKDRLYLPIYRLHEIERYVGGDAKAPRLDRMGGSTFLVKIGKVRKQVRQLAEELLQIYAQRESRERTPYPASRDLYLQFEATFPFEETPDQADAIVAVQKDLSSSRPMDRLICGDVGFGKTEVALRAAFRTAIAGKQVAVLAPTTVLVQQHYQTFLTRMEHFPLRIEHLSRFMSPAEVKRVIAGIRTGEVDVVIGTHRLLSRDVRFQDLGLVVIDEEQRFGVAQKERFKKLRTKVDVLTLTATPIPRTLHMSLLGLREISLITTPPVDRLAVRTHVTRTGDGVIEDGIRRELARGGQIFYVVPRIQGIEEHAHRIRELVPEARVLVAHGSMSGDLLERAMVDFVEHRADVLVSTTIIESGLDIPRANTIFIARADQFGLSQLYQLRGRVGRSRLRAYCYLMVNALERLSTDASKRLEAIQRHAELGSGFQIASQDLEIRGAGELLGGRQSGQIQAIGFDAYARVLSEAVAELKGAPISYDRDPELAFDLPAFLPESYIPDVGQRLGFYRRLSVARDRDQIADVLAELSDRFGSPPLEAEHLGLMMTCKVYGLRLRALSLELRQSRFSLRLGDETPLDASAALALQRSSGGRIKVKPERIIVDVRRPSGPDRRAQLHDCISALNELTDLL